MDILASRTEAGREDLTITSITRVTLCSDIASVTTTDMVEGMEDNIEGQELKESYSVPPLPRLSVIKEASLQLLPQHSQTLHQHHQFSAVQERLSNVSKIVQNINHINTFPACKSLPSVFWWLVPMDRV